jgi:hypothetical protein
MSFDACRMDHPISADLTGGKDPATDKPADVLRCLTKTFSGFSYGAEIQLLGHGHLNHGESLRRRPIPTHKIRRSLGKMFSREHRVKWVRANVKTLQLPSPMVSLYVTQGQVAP